MPGLAMMYNDMVREPMQMVLDEVRLEGLTKLVTEGISVGITLITPDATKVPQKEWAAKCDEMDETWDRTHNGPYPTHLYLSTVWMPKKLVTPNGNSQKIVQTYTPINFVMPTAEKETYGELKKRIEEESMRAVKHVGDAPFKGEVNAFYVGNLRTDYELPLSTRQCMPIAGDSFMNKPARNSFIPRIAFDLCLFEIEEK